MRKQLLPVPKDSIQAVATEGNLLAITAWDSTIHVYNLRQFAQSTQFKTPAPALCLTIFNGSVIYGASDGQIIMYNLQTNEQIKLTRLSGAVRTIHKYMDKYIIATSLSSELVYFNINKSEQKQTQYLKERAFCSYLQKDKLLIATACRNYLIYSMQEINDNLVLAQTQSKESPLRHQTRSCCLTTQQQPVLASVEGRVAIEGTNGFAFRAHKSEPGADGSVFCYPVNVVIPYKDKFLFTAGSDGYIYIWDLEQHKKVYKIQESYAVANMCIANDMLIVCKSYNWENRAIGKNGEEVEIVVYKITDFGLQ